MACHEQLLDTTVRKEMQRHFVQWRNVELFAVVSSLIGLLFALVNYELGAYLYTDKGLGALNYDDPKKNTVEMINKAIATRREAPVTAALRWCNFASCWITIALLIRRNQLKTAWANKFCRT